MPVTFELPQPVEHALRARVANLDDVAKEALLVELYRQHSISHHQFGQALGLSRYETDGFLKRHGVMLEITPEEFKAELDSLTAAELLARDAARHR